MAQPTTPHPGSTPHQAPTHGVGQTPGHVGSMGTAPMKAPAQTKDTPGAEPVLLPDIDPIYLARLYPGAFAEGDTKARADAMAAGRKAYEEGMTLQAAAQEPIAVPAPA